MKPQCILFSVFPRIGLLGLMLAAVLGSALAAAKPPKPSIYAFNVSGTGTINAGEAATLNWSVGDATIVTLTPDVGVVTGTEAEVKPTVTTTYTLTATNSTGTVTKTKKITVVTPPPAPVPAVINSFTASPVSAYPGQDVTLNWSVSGTSSLWLSADNGGDPGSMNGKTSTVVHPAVKTRYTLTAWSAATGNITKSVTVDVSAPLPPQVLSFTATPAEVIAGSSATLAWTTSGAAEVSISADHGTSPGVVTGTSIPVTPASTTVYTLTAKNVSGTATKTVTVAIAQPPPPPVITGFTASPDTITSGSSTLAWTVSGATSLSLQADSGANPGDVTGKTNYVVSPQATTRYTLTARNAGGSDARVIQVTVSAPAPTIEITSLTATPASVNAGDEVKLSWTVVNADSLWMSADNNGDPGSMNGKTSTVVHPTVTTRYALTAYSSKYGTIAKSVIVTVGPPPLPEIASFSATPDTITKDGTATLNWSVANATTVSIAASTGTSPGEVTGSSYAVSPGVTTTYTLTAVNAFGNRTQSTTVTVTGPTVPRISAFTATPAFVPAGQSSTLAWTVNGADSLALSANHGTAPSVGTGDRVSVTPTEATTYTLSATNAQGTSTATVTVTPYTPGGGGSVPHPRIWITETSSSSLRQRAQLNDAAWLKLRNDCDGYVAMRVAMPDEDPSSGTINGGYQYLDYLQPATALGLAYQVTKVTDPARAAKYLAKEKELLLALSDPVHHGRPTTDSGYSIRAYVPALALGYDWIYDTLSDGERAQIFTEINRWVASFDQEGFGRNFPNGNYFAGYYCAKALGALATEGDNPQAAAMWDDWLNRIHFGMVQPYYSIWLYGGAPDGWNYGAFETINMVRPIAAAFTAKGLDLIHHAKPFAFPEGHADWITHFTWPDLTTVNDRGLLYEGSNPAPASAAWATQYAGLLRLANGDNAPIAQQYMLDLRAKMPNDRAESWAEFLFYSASAPAADYRTDLSMRTVGDGQVAMRSSWSNDAVWAAFQSGPYTGFQDSAEEYYDEGSLAIQRGGVQFLVNATGALLRDTPGTEDGGANKLWNLVYDEMFGTQTDGVYHGRRLFNTFYAKRAEGYWGQENPNPGQTRTTLSRFEDRGHYAIMRGAHLEDMYATDHPIIAWTRTVAYLRPELFIAYDRTQVSSANADNWMAWHVAAAPAEQAGAATGTHRFDVLDTRAAFGGNLYRGRVTTVLPAGNQVTTVDTFGRGKVYRLEVRPGAASAANTWLTVFDASASAANAATVAPLTAAAGNVLAGNVEGALIAKADGSRVAVLFSTSGTPSPGTVSFTVPAGAAKLLLVDLAPSSGYTVQVMGGANAWTISIVAGGSLLTTSEGALEVDLSAAGVITAP